HSRRPRPLPWRRAGQLPPPPGLAGLDLGALVQRRSRSAAGARGQLRRVPGAGAGGLRPMVWEPFALALLFGMIISGGIYFLFVWPRIEPEDVEEVEEPPELAPPAAGD